jgi:hypothetical protein
MKHITLACALALCLLSAHAQPPTPPIYTPVTPTPAALVADVALHQLAPGVMMLTWASTQEVCVIRERGPAALGCSTAGALSDVWAQWGDTYVLRVGAVVVARRTLSAVWLPLVSQ